ncbi:DUF554 domain-containing protein [Atopobiaceae bacterium 24-176]
MVMLGALVNALLTVAGGVAGLALRRHISQALSDYLMEGLGLCVILVAVGGMKGQAPVLVVVASVVAGSIAGRALNTEGALQRLGDRVQKALARAFKGSAAMGRFSEGFVAATLFTCVGSMAVVGSLQSGLAGDHGTLFAKGAIDMVVVAVMAASMGVGVLFSGPCIFVYEAALSVGASLLAPALTGGVIGAMTVTGSLLLFAVGLNMLGVTHIKVANMLPAAFVPVLFAPWLG